APGETAHSHGRSGLYSSAYAGAASTGVPFADTVGTFSPNAGDTMAETRSRTSCSVDSPPCAAMLLKPEVIYDDVWTDPAVRAPDASFTYSYLAGAPAGGAPWLAFNTPAPASNGCLVNWSTTCRIIINYTEHIQPLWDKLRQDVDMNNNVVADHTCSQGGCHSPKDAQGNPAVPADSLDLTATASNQQPLQLVSYLELLTPRDELQLVNGLPVPVTQPGPPDANGQPTQVNVQLAPPLLAGDARDSTAFFGIFAQGSGDKIHAGILSPSELRLVSEWLDIGAQYFNNPFDPKAPLD